MSPKTIAEWLRAHREHGEIREEPVAQTPQHASRRLVCECGKSLVCLEHRAQEAA